MTAVRLFTVGYEGDALGAVLARLKAAGVERVIDVRAVAASRRPGFSKTMLAASLEAEGIDYVHLRALGTPKSGREAARAGRIEEMRAVFDAHLTEPESLAGLDEAERLAREKPSTLLCYEADPKGCHRSIVAERLSARTGAATVHL